MEKETKGKSSVQLRPVQELYNPASRLTIRPKTSGLYKHEPHIVYAEAYGVGLVMDVFQPLENPNGFGIIDVVSNGWFSDRHQLIQHIGLGIYDVLCRQGYSVFALSPGSIQVFNGMQMVRNVQAGIQYILSHAEQYGIDKKRLGMMGISAGGHLAINALFQEPKFIGSSPAEKKPYYKYIPTIALFCAPTDLLSFYSLTSLPFDIKEILKRLARRKTFLEEEIHLNEKEIETSLKELSPIYFHVEKIDTPPSVLLFHGTKDMIVPFLHSENFYKKLKTAQWDCEFIIKDNAPHIWKEMSHDFEYLGKRFMKRLQSNP